MIYKEFYAEIGKLLYSVADVDGAINKKEKEKLQDIVRKELTVGEKHFDRYHTNVAFYTEFEFDFEDEQIAEPEVAFNSFIDFVEDHHTAFTGKMKAVCLHIVEELASAYRGTNKKEKILIKKLKDRLQKIEIKKEHHVNSR